MHRSPVPDAPSDGPREPLRRAGDSGAADAAQAEPSPPPRLSIYDDDVAEAAAVAHRLRLTG